MNIFESIAGSVKGMITYAEKKDDFGKLKEMGHEELMSTASRLKNENCELKKRLMALEKENGLLKNCVLNTEEDSSSHFGKLFNSLKTTFLSMEDDDFNEKNINEFKAFLYNQSLFFGGIEEDDITYLNQFVNKSDEDWKTNKDVFLFKQTILERNYRELLSNVLVSPELNSMMINKYGKENLHNLSALNLKEKNQNQSQQIMKTPDNHSQLSSKETVLSPQEMCLNFKDNNKENAINKNNSEKHIIAQPQIEKAKNSENANITPIKSNEKENMKKKEYISSNKLSQIKKSDQNKDVLASN